MITTKNALYSPIPLDTGRVDGWKDILIKEADQSDPLVPLGPLSDEANGLITSSVYFGEHSSSPYAEDTNMLDESLLTIFARRSVARRLLAAEQLLPSGYHLLIFDVYRSFRVQKSLHNFYKKKLKKKHPHMDEEALTAETQKYVSLPSQNPAVPSPHSTGGAVDLAIVKLDQAHEKELLRIRGRLANKKLGLAERVGLEIHLSAIIRNAEMLDFGTAFDHGGEKSALAYYESKLAAGETLTHEELPACNNRRLLYGAMTQAGFQPYFAEWWHFNATESQMGAATAGLTHATFGATTLSKNNRAHENTRLKIRQQALGLQREGDQAAPRTDLQVEILAAMREMGDPQLGGDWPIEVIAPPED